MNFVTSHTGFHCVLFFLNFYSCEDETTQLNYSKYIREQDSEKALCSIEVSVAGYMTSNHNCTFPNHSLDARQAIPLSFKGNHSSHGIAADSGAEQNQGL